MKKVSKVKLKGKRYSLIVNREEEVERALNYLVTQILKGYSIPTAMHQVENSYGYVVYGIMLSSIRRVLN